MRWIAWLAVAACSSGSTAREPVRSLPTGDPAAEAAPSERECDELITHAVALGIDERAAHAAHQAHSGESPTTPADHEALRRKLHEDFMTGCRSLPRGAFRCAMTASTLAALAACQPTRSSSTSNSSVAPGGITPPAPRSP
jgi:hypothetical protein